MLEFDYINLENLPPIPIASLCLSNLNNNDNLIMINNISNAILDTGSDCTLFPYSIISRIQPKPIGSLSKQSFRGLGTKISGIPYRIGIGFEENLIIKITVFACPDDVLQNEIIIGRNFLNQYRIEFNGPKRIFLIY
jgi:Retroviral aspartyl protease